MPERRSRSVLFPLILILAGVALLLDQFGLWRVNWFDLLRLWPLVLVLLGLDLILSRTRAGGIISVLIILAIVAIVLLFYRAPAASDGGLERQSFSQSAQGITSADVRLEVDAGEVTVDALQDSPNLFEAEVSYDQRRTTVQREVQAKGGQAQVSLRSKIREVGWLPSGLQFNERWQVGLNSSVPMQLEVNTGMGKSTLNLAGLEITRLQINAGVGQVDAVFPAEGSYDASISGGLGKVVVEIPSTIEARIRVDRGLSALNIGQRYHHEGNYYVTAGYNSAKNRVNLTIDGGLGEISVR